MVRSLKLIAGLLYTAGRDFVDDSAELQAAALAFYALFTVGPLLVIATAAAGALFGEQAVSHQLSGQLATLLSPEAAALVERMVASASEPGSGILATLIGVVTLVIGATRGFAQLQASLNAVWNVRARQDNAVRVIRTFALTRLLSLAAVLMLGIVLAASLALSAVIGAFGQFVGELVSMPTWVVGVVDSGVDFVLLVVFLGLIYKVFPDAKVQWRDVGLGASVTAALLVLGQIVFSLYISYTAVTSGYGPAGSLVAVMLFAYLSAMAFLFGAEITQAWAVRHGRPIQPSSSAVWVVTPVRERTDTED